MNSLELNPREDETGERNIGCPATLQEMGYWCGRMSPARRVWNRAMMHRWIL